MNQFLQNIFPNDPRESGVGLIGFSFVLQNADWFDMPTGRNPFHHFVDVVSPGQKKATLNPAMNQSAMNHAQDMG